VLKHLRSHLADALVVLRMPDYNSPLINYAIND
jgi:hypothetical protein